MSPEILKELDGLFIIPEPKIYNLPDADVRFFNRCIRPIWEEISQCFSLPSDPESFLARCSRNPGLLEAFTRPGSPLPVELEFPIGNRGRKLPPQYYFINFRLVRGPRKWDVDVRSASVFKKYTSDGMAHLVYDPEVPAPGDDIFYKRRPVARGTLLYNELLKDGFCHSPVDPATMLPFDLERADREKEPRRETENGLARTSSAMRRFENPQDWAEGLLSELISHIRKDAGFAKSFDDKKFLKLTEDLAEEYSNRLSSLRIGPQNVSKLSHVLDNIVKALRDKGTDIPASSLAGMSAWLEETKKQLSKVSGPEPVILPEDKARAAAFYELVSGRNSTFRKEGLYPTNGLSFSAREKAVSESIRAIEDAVVEIKRFAGITENTDEEAAVENVYEVLAKQDNVFKEYYKYLSEKENLKITMSGYQCLEKDAELVEIDRRNGKDLAFCRMGVVRKWVDSSLSSCGHELRIGGAPIPIEEFGPREKIVLSSGGSVTVTGTDGVGREVRYSIGRQQFVPVDRSFLEKSARQRRGSTDSESLAKTKVQKESRRESRGRSHNNSHGV